MKEVPFLEKGKDLSEHNSDDKLSGIKLIASDMDGTLLTSGHSLPPDFFEILDELQKRNIMFVAASGRPYYTLYDNFNPSSNKISYISENGACVVENGEISYKNTLSRKHLCKVIDICKDIEDIYVILCGTKGAHILNLPELVNEIGKYYSRKFVVDDLKNVQDDIFKIGICDMKTPNKNSYKKLYPALKDELSMVVSGELWIDVMNIGINKGVALENIQNQFGIQPEETMVFGDFYNDIEMLSKAKYSFVMENANDDMKIHGKYIAKNNNEYGVTEAIKKYILR